MRLQAFAGQWEIERAIEDARAGRAGRFTGRASFTPVPQGLAYREQGTLTFDSAPAMTATRTYLWRDGGADTIEVWFDDGRFFHRFNGDAQTPAAEHACPPDHYRVRYDFAQWPRWRAAWRVEGPDKNYALVSAYRPVAAGK